MQFADDLLWKRFALAPSGKAADAAEEAEDDTKADDAAEDAEATDDAESAEDAEDKGAVADEVEDEPEDTAEERSLKVDGLSDDPEEAHRQIQAWRQQAAEAQRYREYSAILYQQAETARQMAARQVQAQPKPESWQPAWGKAPDFDPARLQHITAEDLQNDLALKAQYQSYLDWQRKAQQTLYTDPVTALYPGFEPKIQQQVNQIVQQQLRAYQVQSELKSFENANREWIYDDRGQLTPAAQLWNQHYSHALQMNMPDPIQYAENVLNAEAYRMRLAEDAQRAATPKEKPEADKKSDFLHAAARKPNRSGTFPRKTRKTPDQNSKRDPWDELREKLDSLPPEDFNDA